MTVDETITRHLSVRGRVQGVGYRNYLAYKAGELGIGGWVRNRSDGSVEAVVHGTPQAVAAIIDCARRGPRAAQVTAVDVAEITGSHPQFSVRATE